MVLGLFVPCTCVGSPYIPQHFANMQLEAILRRNVQGALCPVGASCVTAAHWDVQRVLEQSGPSNACSVLSGCRGIGVGAALAPGYRGARYCIPIASVL